MEKTIAEITRTRRRKTARCATLLGTSPARTGAASHGDGCVTSMMTVGITQMKLLSSVVSEISQFDIWVLFEFYFSIYISCLSHPSVHPWVGLFSNPHTLKAKVVPFSFGGGGGRLGHWADFFFSWADKEREAQLSQWVVQGSGGFINCLVFFVLVRWWMQRWTFLMLGAKPSWQFTPWDAASSLQHKFMLEMFLTWVLNVMEMPFLRPIIGWQQLCITCTGSLACNMWNKQAVRAVRHNHYHCKKPRQPELGVRNQIVDSFTWTPSVHPTSLMYILGSL